MKIQDKLNIFISLVALLLSVTVALTDWVRTSRNDEAQRRRSVYDAYNLGQQASEIYAYARSGNKAPQADGGTGDAVADNEIANRTFAAESYAQSLQVSPDRFITFRNLLETGQPDHVSDAFGLLNPDVQASGGTKAVAAYELGWQTLLLGIGLYGPDKSVGAVQNYPGIRDTINGYLTTLGLPKYMPASVSNGTDFTAAIKNTITSLNKLQP